MKFQKPNTPITPIYEEKRESWFLLSRLELDTVRLVCPPKNLVSPPKCNKNCNSNSKQNYFKAYCVGHIVDLNSYFHLFSFCNASKILRMMSHGICMSQFTQFSPIINFWSTVPSWNFSLIILLFFVEISNMP